MDFDQSGSPIYAELVYESPAPDRSTVSAVPIATLSATSLTVPDAPPSAQEPTTASPSLSKPSPVPTVENSSIAALPVSTAKGSADVEPAPTEALRPNNVEQERPRVVLQSARRVTVVPRHKPPAPQARSTTVPVVNKGADEEAKHAASDPAAPLLPSVEPRQAPKTEKTQDRGAKVAALPAGGPRPSGER